jgi:hypothetical protein
MQNFKLPARNPETEHKPSTTLYPNLAFQGGGTDTSPNLRIVSPQTSESGLHPGWKNEPPQRKTWQEELPIKKSAPYPEQWDKPARKPFDIEKTAGRIILWFLVISFLLIAFVAVWRVIGALATVKLV